MRLGKILVVGAGEAGKSTLIQALTCDAMNLAVNGRTVAMDHATLVDGDDRLSLVGVPGQERFGVVRTVLAVGARGAVWVHRAGYQLDTDTAEIITDLGAPYLVYVNYDDGAARGSAWRLPPRCPSPEAVIEGNLLHPGASRFTLWTALWKMARQSADHGTEGVPHANPV